jgi:hypothetical protein
MIIIFNSGWRPIDWKRVSTTKEKGKKYIFSSAVDKDHQGDIR